jgi:hypothetical protein
MGQLSITFNAGFNSRFEKYAVRAFKFRDYVPSPLSRQDSVMQLPETAFVNRIVITCDKLPSWPIQLRIDLPRGRRIFKGFYPDRGKMGHYKLLFDDAPR